MVSRGGRGNLGLDFVKECHFEMCVLSMVCYVEFLEAEVVWC